MPSSDYGNAVGGGLKLKGVKDAGVKKSKKKKSKVDSEGSKSIAEGEDEQIAEKSVAKQVDSDGDEKIDNEVTKSPESGAKQSGRTEAQRRHEEMRKKRLDERLKREGIKTHKERVEELNKYLSTLSEHHDMPRIGPG